MEQKKNNTPGQVDVLMERYLSGDATEHEIEAFFAWIDEDEKNMSLFERVRSVWNAGTVSFSPDEISTRDAWKALDEKISSRDGNEKHSGGGYRIVSVLRNVAAILAVPLIASTLWLSLRLGNITRQGVAVHEISALPGTVTKVSLPDGTMAWLNGGSSIEYPEKFTGKSRELSMLGEVYFEVDSDRKHPFVVHTQNVDITAVGTSFNVQAYQEDSLVSVTLAEGIVDVSMHETETTLVPGSRVVSNVNTGEHEILTGEPYRWCSWKDGILMFRNDPLGDVFKRLGQIYNTEFIVDEEIQDDPYYATFKNDPLDRILVLLSRTAPISYRTVGETEAVSEKEIIEVYCRK